METIGLVQNMKNKLSPSSWRSPASATAMRLSPKTRCHSCVSLYKIGRTCNCMKLNLTTDDNAWCMHYELAETENGN